MIIESGIIIFLGLVFLGAKLPIHISLRLLGKPLALDVGCSVLAFLMHYGTFSGVMAAAVAGLLCSGFTSAARKAIGYIEGGVYTPGKVWIVPRDKLKLND
jgi:hypothetical protein